jgi:hypothetical protein
MGRVVRLVVCALGVGTALVAMAAVVGDPAPNEANRVRDGTCLHWVNQFGCVSPEAFAALEPLGPPVFHYSEIMVKKRVDHVYPDAARDADLGQVTCRVRVFIDEKGLPTETRIEHCPAAFHASTHDALWQWEWEPARLPLTGDVCTAQFLMAIRYVP